MKFILIPLFLVTVSGADFTLPGICPTVTFKEKFDYNRFSGVWHNVGGYASDGRPIHDCSTLELQKADQGYTLRETYVEDDGGKRTQKWYLAKVATLIDPGKHTQFMIHRNISDKVLRHPFMILSTDYEDYAIAYMCIWLNEKEEKHYVFTWILTRRREKLHGDTLKKIEDALAEFPELAEHREEFVFKEFNNGTCAFEQKIETNFYDSYFC